MVVADKKVDYLVVDTTAFIENAPLQDIANNIVTVQEVVDEITNKRQLRRLVVLPYDLAVKEVFPESVRIITEFSQKTGDYPNLSATDIKVMALTYQLEKAEVGTDHLRKEPLVRKTVTIASKPKEDKINVDISGFFMPKQHKQGGGDSREVIEKESQEDVKENPDTSKEQDGNDSKNIEDLTNLADDLEEIKLNESTSENVDDLILPKKSENIHSNLETSDYDDEEEEEEDNEDDEIGWITPSNVQAAKKQMNSGNFEEKFVKVACITTDFAMQNVLKQMNLNVSALDGRIIKELKTYILRCYSCFKTTGIMTRRFCQKCGNATLKRVSVSVDSDGKQRVHINARRPLTSRGKKFSLPTAHGGKHCSNPILSADQPLPDQKPTRLARMKNNPLNDDYIAGYSPFVMRDVNSKSAQLGIRSVKEVKHWMKKNPNETSRRRK